MSEGDWGTSGRGLLLDEDEDEDGTADAMRDLADCPVEMLPLDLLVWVLKLLLLLAMIAAMVSLVSRSLTAAACC